MKGPKNDVRLDELLVKHKIVFKSELRARLPLQRKVVHLIKIEDGVNHLMSFVSTITGGTESSERVGRVIAKIRKPTQKEFVI